MLTEILPVRKNIQIGFCVLEYDVFLVWWTQIWMYLIPSKIYTGYLPSHIRIPLYRRFVT